MNLSNSAMRNLVIGTGLAIVAGVGTFVFVDGTDDHGGFPSAASPGDVVGDAGSDDLLGGDDDDALGDAGSDDLLGGDDDDALGDAGSDDLLGGDDDVTGVPAPPSPVSFCPVVVHRGEVPGFPSFLQVFTEVDTPGTVALLMPPAFLAEPVFADVAPGAPTGIPVGIDQYGDYRIERVSFTDLGGNEFDLTQQVIDLNGGDTLTVGPDEGPLWTNPACDAIVDTSAFATVP